MVPMSTPGISVLRESRIALETVPVHAMHDPTEGGLATGLLELALAGGVGLEVDGEAIPVLLAGKDLLGQAATGTGKTAAFALPLLDLLSRDAGRRHGTARALVLAPASVEALGVLDRASRPER